MGDSKPKLTFIPKQARVRCEFSRQHCLNDPNGADAVIERAKKRMRNEKKSGRVSFYRIFATRLRSMWKLMAESAEPLETTVAVTVASGAPALLGLKVEVSKADDLLGYLTIDADAATVKSWQPFFVKLTIGKLLRDAGVERIPNPVQLQRLWEHACDGSSVIKVPIIELPSRVPPENGKPFRLFEDSSRQDISAVIYDVNRMLEKENLDDLIARLASFRDRSNANGSNYEIQFDELVRSLRSASRGPERYGLDLPMVLLAAYDKSRLQVSAHAQSPNQSARLTPKATAAEAKVKVEPHPPRITFRIALDGMEATILKFDPAWYAQFPNLVSTAWLKKAAEAQGIKFGFSEEIEMHLREKIDNQHSLEGLVFARGQMLEEGKGPFLHKVFEEAMQSAEERVVSIRDRQRHGFVNRGQVIGEIRFKTPAKDKITVRGVVTPAPRPDMGVINCGEGVEQSGEKFIAKVDGVPIITETSISITKGLRHQGNVDLASGNIRFVGNVVITGNVEPGAVIDVQGNVEIGGSIIGGDIRVEGSLVTKGGISGARGKFVFVTGDLTTNFIENSKVRARGNIHVQRSILASEVHAGGEINVLAGDGHIIGSQIYAEMGLTVANFGRQNGAVTEAFLGCCFGAENSHRLRVERLRKLQELKSSTDLKYRQIRDRPEQQKTDKHRTEESLLQKYSNRISDLVRICEGNVHAAKERINPNKEAVANIREVLAPGSRFTIAGKKFVNRDAVAGVVLRLHAGSIKVDALQDIPAPSVDADKKAG